MGSNLILRRSIYPATAAARSCCNWICARRVSTEAVVGRISSTPPAPWMMIEDGGFEEHGLDNMVYNFYNLADKQVVSVDKKRGKDGMVVGSSHGWLALMKWRRSSYKWRRMRNVLGIDMLLYNPLSHRHVNLPPIETLSIQKHKFRKGSGCPVKLILSCPPDEDEDGKCRAVMFFGNEHRLAYCVPGRSKEWTPLGDLYHDDERTIPWMYQDIVYSHTKQSLFCMTVCSDFESWDLRDPRSPIMNWKLLNNDMPLYGAADSRCPRCGKGDADRLKSSPFELFKYLVFAERSDRLFVVSRRVKIHRGPNGYHDYSFPYQTVGFDVDEIVVVPGGGDNDGEKRELRRMSGNLDGMSFFIGSKGHGFVVAADDDDSNGRVERNSIYFTDSHQLTPRPWSKKKATCGGHDIGIFNYENSTFAPCYYPRDLESARRMNPAPTWFTPSSSFLSSVA